MSLNIPTFLQAFNHLSPIKWAIGNLAPYALAGVHSSCPEVQQSPNGQCPVNDGEEVLNLYNSNGNPGLNLLAPGICLVVYRKLAFLLLEANRTRWALKERLGGDWTKHEKAVGADVVGEGKARVV